MWALAFVYAGACGGSEPSVEPSGSAFDSVAEPSSVSALFTELGARVRAGDHEAVRGLVLDYRGPDGLPVADEVIEGIVERDDAGDWSFSLEGLDELVRRSGEFIVPEGRLAEQLQGSFGRLDPRLAVREDLRVFDGGQGTHVIVVRLDDGAHRLAFWEGVAELGGGPGRPPSATSDGAE